MGVNTLAFRAAQHGAFYVADPDCVGVTTGIPWSFNKQWLDLLAASGTMLFVSIAPDALGAEQRRDLRAALALAAEPHPLGQPLNWQHTALPTQWKLINRERRFDWGGAEDPGAG
jgi:alpha-galactosidase